MPTWNARRLAALLNQEYRGDQVLVLANREPCRHDRAADGRIVITRTASGLVTAVEPIVRACHGVWIAHGAGSADRCVVDRRHGIGVPEENPKYRLRRVWLSDAEHRGYYGGFANEGLWPVCHDVGVPPVFRPEDFNHYRTANARFANAAVEEAVSHSPLVFVHDYHLALTPRLIRRRLPHSTVVTFWHIPWPHPDQVEQCPWADALMTGLLGSSLLGFQTAADSDRFLQRAARVPGAVVDRRAGGVMLDGHRTLVRAYPIAIEHPSPRAHQAPPPEACRAGLVSRLNLGSDVRLVVGVDRLDYTKGIAEKCDAVAQLLESRPEHRGKVTLVQIAEPSRESLPAYRENRHRVLDAAARVNARFGHDGYRPVVLLEAHHEPSVVLEYLRAADVCYVGSLRDGMNLVAKEFVAARTDRQGVLLLSRHAGAAEQLDGAVLLDPRDPRAAAEMLRYALQMPQAEQERRMTAMHDVVSEFNLYWWAGQILEDAAALRGISAGDLRYRPDGHRQRVRVA